MNYEQYSDELFNKARDRIMPFLLDKHTKEIEREVLDIIEALDGRQSNGEETKSFSEWGIEQLLSAQGRLSTLRVNLGVLASSAQGKTNFSMRYKVYQESKHWNPVKTKLEKEFDRLNKKVLKGDIEATLVEAFWETTQKEVFLQEISDRLKIIHDSTNQVLTAIRMKINYLMKEEQEAKFNTGVVRNVQTRRSRDT